MPPTLLPYAPCPPERPAPHDVFPRLCSETTALFPAQSGQILLSGVGFGRPGEGIRAAWRWSCPRRPLGRTRRERQSPSGGHCQRRKEQRKAGQNGQRMPGPQRRARAFGFARQCSAPHAGAFAVALKARPGQKKGSHGTAKHRDNIALQGLRLAAAASCHPSAHGMSQGCLRQSRAQSRREPLFL